MQRASLKIIAAALSALFILDMPLCFSAGADRARAEVKEEKSSALLLKKLRATVPGTDQVALMNLYNDASIGVQLSSADLKPFADFTVFAQDGQGKMRFYADDGDASAELSLTETSTSQWVGEGHVNALNVHTLSNHVLKFDGLKMENSQFGSDQTVNGVLKSSDSRLNVTWHVVLGRGEHAGVSLLFDPYDQSHGPDKRYFILKKTPFGLTELNYKFNSRQLFIDRRSGEAASYTILLEYVPETADEKIKKDVAKLKVQKKGNRIGLKLQSYPERNDDRTPPTYREVELLYDEMSKSFSLAEDRTFQMNSNGEYGVINRNKLDLEKDASLSDVMANIINNHNKILGDQGISVPSELIDFISLLDPAYQEGLLRDAFLKHVSEFLINDARDPVQPELLAASIDTVLFDRGLSPVMKFLVDTSPQFSTLIELYDKTAKVRFEKDRLFLKTPKPEQKPAPEAAPEVPPVAPAPEAIKLPPAPEKKVVVAPAPVEVPKEKAILPELKISPKADSLPSAESSPKKEKSPTVENVPKKENVAKSDTQPEAKVLPVVIPAEKTEKSESVKAVPSKVAPAPEVAKPSPVPVKIEVKPAEVKVLPEPVKVPAMVKKEMPPPQKVSVATQPKKETPAPPVEEEVVILQPKPIPLAPVNKEQVVAAPQAKTTASAPVKKEIKKEVPKEMKKEVRLKEEVSNASFEPDGMPDQYRVNNDGKDTGFEAFRVIPAGE